MCGIIGTLRRGEGNPVPLEVLQGMLGMIRHRGPDEFGVYRDARVGLGSARLSIIDLSGGSQPIGNEDGRYWIVFNGEIFNYLELRSDLEKAGHRFSTHTDTEVILHLFEEHGAGCLAFLNGQFAIAIWDALERRLFLARDRLGIRPLFYANRSGELVFASEIKALFAFPGISAEVDPDTIAKVFTFWSPLPPGTAFRGIHELPPAHYLVAGEGGMEIRRYWSLDFTEEPGADVSPGRIEEELEALLIDSAKIRLRADVPVGAYLSGGLDSSLTTAIVRRHAANHLETFSIAFENPVFDESEFQVRMAGFLGTQHRVVRCSHADIAGVFPDVVWHTEAPVLRTAPAPMFLLSKLVNENRLKVVLTGERADEVLGGYDIFKEAKIRRFWARQPESTRRSQLLRRIYPDIAGLGLTSDSFLTAFFRRDLEDTANPFYSHLIRWNNTARTRRFLVGDVSTDSLLAALPPLPEGFSAWSGLGKAQYLEATVFLSEYLLASQGDRVAMAHSVEGRYPFLDYRVVEFAGRIPARFKLRGLTEKWILKRIGRRYLPPEIWNRPKRPYRAPVHRSFFPDSPDYVEELLSEAAVLRSGIFKPAAVGQLVRKAAGGASLSEVEDMALVGVLSTQLLYWRFVENFQRQALPSGAQVKIVDQTGRSNTK